MLGLADVGAGVLAPPPPPTAKPEFPDDPPQLLSKASDKAHKGSADVRRKTELANVLIAFWCTAKSV